MDRHIPDEHLDRLMRRFLSERQAEVVSTARTAAEVARIGRSHLTPSASRPMEPAMTRSARLLLVGLSLAALLVALAGGALLIGSRTEDQISDSLTGWVTEELEPGVVRVVNDGFRDLAPVTSEPHYRELTIGMDGSIWTWNSLDGELHRLGDPVSYPVAGLPGDGAIVDLQIDPDGVLWAGGPYGAYRLDGEAWTKLRPDPLRLDIAPDGTVWTAWRYAGAAGLGKLTATGWEDHPVDVGVIAEALGVGPDGIRYHEVSGFRAAPDGSVWVGLRVGPHRGQLDDLLMRFDGREWAVVDPSGAGRWGEMNYFDVGADGTAWVYLDFQQLARSSGGEWTVYTVEDGVTAIGVPGETWGYLEAGPDGTVWVDETKTSRAGDCRGVRSFDGSTWGRYLDGVCVADLQIAPDGAVWVVGAKDPESFRGGRHKAGDTYRIDPALAEVGDESP